MTVNEAAALLGIRPDTLRHQIRLGVLKATHHGAGYWITPGAVKRYQADSLGQVGPKPKKETARRA